MNAHRNTLHLATILLALAPALFAQGPHKAPKQEGTVKPAVGVPSDLFERQMALIGPRKAGWLGKAAQATPGAVPRHIFSPQEMNVTG